MRPAQLETDEESAFLRFEEFLFAPNVYADAYDRVSQALRMGRAEELCVTAMLRESSTNQTIGVARLHRARGCGYAIRIWTISWKSSM